MFKSLTEIEKAISLCKTLDEVKALPNQECSINCWFEYGQKYGIDNPNRSPYEVLFEATRKSEQPQ